MKNGNKKYCPDFLRNIIQSIIDGRFGNLNEMK